MENDTWSKLADQFVDEAYASVKGRVRTYVIHQQLLDHLPPNPTSILDVGGGAGNQSIPLAQIGYNVTLLDPSSAMLDKARQQLKRMPEETQQRVTIIKLMVKMPTRRLVPKDSLRCYATAYWVTWSDPNLW